MVKNRVKINVKDSDTYNKPQIEDQRIEIEDSIASSGDDIYNVREIFKNKQNI